MKRIMIVIVAGLAFGVPGLVTGTVAPGCTGGVAGGGVRDAVVAQPPSAKAARAATNLCFRDIGQSSRG